MRHSVPGSIELEMEMELELQQNPIRQSRQKQAKELEHGSTEGRSASRFHDATSKNKSLGLVRPPMNGAFDHHSFRFGDLGIWGISGKR